MEIVWLGHSSFRIKGKGATIVTDPYDPGKTGLKFPKVTADIVTVSHDHFDHNQGKLVGGNPKVLTGPGEYEVSGVSIFGIASYHDDKEGEERGKNTIYRMSVDGVRVCHLGDLGHKLGDEQLEAVGDIDVLLVPVGGVYTIDAGAASEVVSSLEPRVVIPMHYQIKGLNPEIFKELDGVDKFVKELGIEPTHDSKYNTTVDKLPDEMQLVVLELK